MSIWKEEISKKTGKPYLRQKVFFDNGRCNIPIDEKATVSLSVDKFDKESGLGVATAFLTVEAPKK